MAIHFPRLFITAADALGGLRLFPVLGREEEQGARAGFNTSLITSYDRIYVFLDVFSLEGFQKLSFSHYFKIYFIKVMCSN